MPVVPFIGQSFEHRAIGESPQVSLNLYPEIIEDQGAKSKYILIGTPGTSTVVDFTSEEVGATRGLHSAIDSNLYVAMGANIYRVATDWSKTVVMAIGTGGIAPVSMADNGQYLVMADGVNMKVLNLLTDEVTDISYSESLGPNLRNFEKPRMVKYIDGRFVVINDDPTLDGAKQKRASFYYSDVNDPFNWSPLQKVTTQNATKIQSIEVKQGELISFTRNSYEAYRLTVDADFPFSRVGGSYSQIGCGADFSVVQIADKIFWVGASTAGRNQIYMTNGYDAVKISNPAIEYELDKISKDPNSSTEDAIATAYSEEGHIFYSISFISGNKTLVFDVTTNQWHKRATRDARYQINNTWCARYAAYFNNQVVVGSAIDARLMTLDLDKFTEWDDRPIIRVRRSPVYWNELKMSTHDVFEVDFSPGVGLQNNNANLVGLDPQAILRFSDDGGVTWSNERKASIGKIGKYQARARWTGLGSARNRVYEVTISDPVKVVMLNGSLQTRAGSV